MEGFGCEGSGAVSWKPRDSPSARLRSALGRWNPVEQTGLCIYSCLRTYRSELFNRVLSNQPTGAELDRMDFSVGSPANVVVFTRSVGQSDNFGLPLKSQATIEPTKVPFRL
jgi:hypothetical protein